MTFPRGRDDRRPSGPALTSLGFALAVLTAGCGGGAPLLHPARTLPKGEVRAAGGVGANVVVGGLADDLRAARELAVRDGASTTPGASAGSTAFARGALVAAAAAPGLAPFVGARVGVGHAFEGGLAYTGRAARVDVRRSFDRGNLSLSVGLGGTATLYGRQQDGNLPYVDLAALHGYGADLPVLLGFRTDGDLYMGWIGVRGGFEHDVIAALTSEPASAPKTGPQGRLEATRYYGGGVAGLAMGFRHVHVALELDVAYQIVSGTYGQNDVTVRGLTLAPATAVWWSF